MKIGEFIKYLEGLPPETTVNALIIDGRDCMKDWVPFNVDEHAEFIDMRENMFAKGKEWENDVDLYLGEI